MRLSVVSSLYPQRAIEKKCYCCTDMIKYETIEQRSLGKCLFQKIHFWVTHNTNSSKELLKQCFMEIIQLLSTNYSYYVYSLVLCYVHRVYSIGVISTHSSMIKQRKTDNNGETMQCRHNHWILSFKSMERKYIKKTRNSKELLICLYSL